MKFFFSAMLDLLLVTCSSPTDTVATAGPPLSPAVTVNSRAVLATDIDLTSCAAEATARCPAFIIAAAAEMKKTCGEVGGTLHPAGKPVFWQLDIDADGRNEYLVDFAENFYCDGAPSLFSCGSLGCPYILYQERDGKWVGAGCFDASDAPQIEVLAGAGPAILRGGCGGVTPCDELTSYTWNGQAYEATTIEVRGHHVAVAFDGLWTLVRDMPVLASPSPDASVLDRYPMGTEVVVIGDARGAPYKYVSPCNACRSGFIDPAALRKTL